MVSCPNGHATPDSQRICGECGIPLAVQSGYAEARWADDPSGRHRLRYWDGNSWTEHVADNGGVCADPMVFLPNTDVGAVASPEARRTSVAPPPPSAAVVPPVTAAQERGRVFRLMSAGALLAAGVVILVGVFLPWTQQANHPRRFTGWDLTHCSRGKWEGCGIHPARNPLSHPMPLVVAVIVCAAVFVIIGSVTLWATLRGRRFPRGLFLGFGWTAVVIGGVWSNSLPESFSHEFPPSAQYQRLWGHALVTSAGVFALVAMIMFTVATSKKRRTEPSATSPPGPWEAPTPLVTGTGVPADPSVLTPPST